MHFQHLATLLLICSAFSINFFLQLLMDCPVTAVVSAAPVASVNYGVRENMVSTSNWQYWNMCIHCHFCRRVIFKMSPVNLWHGARRITATELFSDPVKNPTPSPVLPRSSLKLRHYRIHYFPGIPCPSLSTLFPPICESFIGDWFQWSCQKLKNLTPSPLPPLLNFAIIAFITFSAYRVLQFPRSFHRMPPSLRHFRFSWLELDIYTLQHIISSDTLAIALYDAPRLSWLHLDFTIAHS